MWHVANSNCHVLTSVTKSLDKSYLCLVIGTDSDSWTRQCWQDNNPLSPPPSIFLCLSICLSHFPPIYQNTLPVSVSFQYLARSRSLCSSLAFFPRPLRPPRAPFNRPVCLSTSLTVHLCLWLVAELCCGNEGGLGSSFVFWVFQVGIFA